MGFLMVKSCRVLKYSNQYTYTRKDLQNGQQVETAVFPATGYRRAVASSLEKYQHGAGDP